MSRMHFHRNPKYVYNVHVPIFLLKNLIATGKNLLFPLFDASVAIEKYVSFSCFKTNSIEYGPNTFSTKAVILVRPQ